MTALNEPIRILHRLQEFGYTSALIAGGAIRDDYFGKPITDIDIFLWDPKFSKEHEQDRHFTPPLYGEIYYIQRTTEFFDILQTFEIQHRLCSNYCGTLSSDDGELFAGSAVHITDLWEAELDGTKYQLIYTKYNPIHHIRSYFDIGLCKAYCDGNKIYYTDDFLADEKHKTLTLLGKDMSFNMFCYSITNHLPRIQAKYPSFTLKIASNNKKHYTNMLALKKP